MEPGDGGVDALVEDAETALARLETLPVDAADTAAEAIDALARVYGTGLERIMSTIAAEAPRALTALSGDELVGHLLVLHGLHPDPVETRVRDALDDLRPQLAARGIDLELASIDGVTAHIRLSGDGCGCSSSSEEPDEAIEAAVLAVAPELEHVAVRDTSADVVIPISSLGRRDAEPAPSPSPFRASVQTLSVATNAQNDGNGEGERCELCAEPIPEAHRHLVEIATGELACACQACALLFDRADAMHLRYRAVTARRRLIEGVDCDDEWQHIGIPVGLAFCYRSTAAERMMSVYPSPAGPTESPVADDDWVRLVERLPVLADLVPDTEALLVHRIRDAREHWLVPIDDCYRLVGIVRRHWEGFSGGDEVWAALEEFFDEVRRTATTVDGSAATKPDLEPQGVSR